ncbi:hypothetical protein D3C75_1115860 [compost metagenome]
MLRQRKTHGGKLLQAFGHGWRAIRPRPDEQAKLLKLRSARITHQHPGNLGAGVDAPLSLLVMIVHHQEQLPLQYQIGRNLR